MKTSGPAVLDPELQLCLDMSYGAVKTDEHPTSLASLHELLDGALTAGEGSFGEAAAGKLPVMIRVRDRQSVRRASALAKDHGLKGALFGSYWTEDLVEEVSASGLGVLCDPVAGVSPLRVGNVHRTAIQDVDPSPPGDHFVDRVSRKGGTRDPT